MITWTESRTITDTIEFFQIWDSNPILISISNAATPPWRKVGYLKIEAVIDGELFLVQFKPIEFGKSLITLPVKTCKLSFEPVDNLLTLFPNSTLKIYQLSPTETSNIMALYSALPTTIGDQPIVDSIPTTFIAPVYAAANPPATYQCLAANAARQSFAITNQGAAPVFLDLDPPSNATKRFITIPANGTYVCDFVYQGAVSIWSSNAIPQSCEVRDFVQ